ncbi:MATE family efflux transporter [Pacificimonas sp. WHA3]|uniref:Multidrug-efflux transporter n=1 Tax=Pacificimonas pallii TaxID=2827236 RepID=A0ABS6SAK0_9SPHN|nr:MATE family efflux transporter [Pacificimonas pallii]MBV7255414.1 MATE family efflux transporter [Pacificimonas pallii]
MTTPAITEIPTERTGLSALLTLAWPVILSRLGIMAMGVTDAIVVGRYSAKELAYHSLGWAPTMVVVTTGIGLLLGVQVLTAQLIGEGKEGDAGAILRRGIIFALGVGFISAAGLYALSDPLMAVMQLEGKLATESAAAMRIFSLSMPTYLVAVVCQFWLEALKRPIPAMWIMWGANALNIFLDVWMVPGSSPFGVDGAVAAGWATVGSRTALMAGLIIYILAWPGSRQYGLWLKVGQREGRRYWREMVRIGTASAGSLFVETAGFAGMNIMAGWIGGLTVAGFAILLNVAGVVFMIPLGLASATAVFVGNGFGARDFNRVRRYGWLGIGFTAAALSILAVFVWFGDELVVSAYAKEADLIAIAVPAIALAALFFTMDGIQVVAANALRAMDDVWIPTLTHTISYVGVMLPLGWYLAIPMEMGLQGLVWGIVIASMLAGMFLLARFKWLTRPGASLRARRAA